MEVTSNSSVSFADQSKIGSFRIVELHWTNWNIITHFSRFKDLKSAKVFTKKRWNTIIIKQRGETFLLSLLSFPMGSESWMLIGQWGRLENENFRHRTNMKIDFVESSQNRTYFKTPWVFRVKDFGVIAYQLQKLTIINITFL